MQGLYHRRGQKRDQDAERAEVPREHALAEHFRHAGQLAEPLQAAGGAHDKEHARNATEHTPRPAGIGEEAEALSRTSEDHDADTDKKEQKRTTDADDQLARRTAAERLARNVAERLLDQHQQRDAGGKQEGHGRSAVSLLGAGCGSCGSSSFAVSKRDAHPANMAPNAAKKSANGRPNKATRPHSAPKMAAAAIGTGANNDKPWLAEIASADAMLAA